MALQPSCVSWCSAEHDRGLTYLFLSFPSVGVMVVQQYASYSYVSLLILTPGEPCNQCWLLVLQPGLRSYLRGFFAHTTTTEYWTALLGEGHPIHTVHTR